MPSRRTARDGPPCRDAGPPVRSPPAALADAAAGAGRTDAATVTASVPLALAPDRDGAARIAARWLVTYATRMRPIYPRMLRRHGYHRELDAVLDANPDPRDTRLPAAAERLAHDVLLYGTYDEAPQRCRAWLHHTDALALVAPFGVPAAQIADTIDAVRPRPQTPYTAAVTVGSVSTTLASQAQRFDLQHPLVRLGRPV